MVDLEYVITALSVAGQTCITAGFGGIYLFTAELAPTPIRNIAMGTSSMFVAISGALAPFVGGPLVSRTSLTKCIIWVIQFNRSVGPLIGLG